MNKWLFRAIYLSILFSLVSTNKVAAQHENDDRGDIIVSAKRGIHFESEDGFMEFRLGFRMQQQIAFTQILNEQDALNANFMIRRARAHFRGFLFNKKLDYFIQLGMDRGNVILLNAEYRWKPNAYTNISFGQFFPPASRQFQTISNNLQMVDRSNVVRFFFTDYDLGVRVRRTLPFSDRFQVKLAGAITHGEGKNLATATGGWAYMGRAEILPFGAFKSNGDYFESDLEREESPKLSIGAGYYLNHDAYTKLGNTAWDGLEDDITDAYADLVFKYNGFSLLVEYITRSIDNELLTVGANSIWASKISGDGVYVQSGKFISEKIETTMRFTYLSPNDAHQTQRNAFVNQTKFAAGLNYFELGHALKIQGQIGYVNEQFSRLNVQNYLELLAQFTLSF